MLEKLLIKIHKHFSGYSCFQEGGCFNLKADSQTVKPVKLPYSKMIFGPFGLLLDNGKQFFMLALPIALLISLVAMLSGFGYMCIYSQIIKVSAYCNDSAVIYLVYSVLKIFLWAVFLIKWYETALLQEPFDLKTLIKIDGRSIKLTLAILLIIFLNFLPMVSGWVLYLRVPNPDWRVEIAFFAVMSIGFLIPFVALRFYSVVSFIAAGKKIPPLKEIWYKTVGGTLALLLGLFLIFIVSVFIYGNLYNNFKSVAFDSSLYINFSSEFIYNILTLMVCAVMMNNFYMQQQILFKEEGEESDATE